MSSLQFYREEFISLSVELKRRIDSFYNLSSSDAAEAATEIDSQMCELKSGLSSYEMELHHCNSAIRNQHKEEAKSFRDTLSDIQRSWLLTINKVAETTDTSTLSSTSSSSSSSSSSSRSLRIPASTRRRAEVAVERLERGNSQLRGCRELLDESETTGDALLQELYVQRETIMRAKANTARARDNLDDADGVIGRMTKWWHSFVS
eukprot:GHVQ01007370.1.p1 GENE.GHVQ01007370.1~~GHVQ01007370.1.p1  ORF type:complete len:206 (+),score=45.38 GHVQ01007370.1:416-1033(+)